MADGSHGGGGGGQEADNRGFALCTVALLAFVVGKVERLSDVVESNRSFRRDAITQTEVGLSTFFWKHTHASVQNKSVSQLTNCKTNHGKVTAKVKAMKRTPSII